MFWDEFILCFFGFSITGCLGPADISSKIDNVWQTIGASWAVAVAERPSLTMQTSWSMASNIAQKCTRWHKSAHNYQTELRPTSNWVTFQKLLLSHPGLHLLRRWALFCSERLELLGLALQLMFVPLTLKVILNCLASPTNVLQVLHLRCFTSPSVSFLERCLLCNFSFSWSTESVVSLGRLDGISSWS